MSGLSTEPNVNKAMCPAKQRCSRLKSQSLHTPVISHKCCLAPTPQLVQCLQRGTLGNDWGLRWEVLAEAGTTTCILQCTGRAPQGAPARTATRWQPWVSRDTRSLSSGIKGCCLCRGVRSPGTQQCWGKRPTENHN